MRQDRISSRYTTQPLKLCAVKPFLYSLILHPLFQSCGVSFSPAKLLPCSNSSYSGTSFTGEMGATHNGLLCTTFALISLALYYEAQCSTSVNVPACDIEEIPSVDGDENKINLCKQSNCSVGCRCLSSKKVDGCTQSCSNFVCPSLACNVTSDCNQLVSPSFNASVLTCNSATSCNQTVLNGTSEKMIAASKLTSQV